MAGAKNSNFIEKLTDENEMLNIKFENYDWNK